MFLSGAATSVRGRRCPSRPRATRPARSSTLRCLEIVGWLRSNGFMSSDTSASPDASRARSARLVGSARAAKARLRGSTCSLIAMWIYYPMAIYKSGVEKHRAPIYAPLVRRKAALGIRDCQARDLPFPSRRRELALGRRRARVAAAEEERLPSNHRFSHGV